MEDNNPPPIPVGTAVRITDSGFGRCWIAEFRGNLGPNGARVYSVCYRRKPRAAFTEVLEEQLEILPPE